MHHTEMRLIIYILKILLQFDFSIKLETHRTLVQNCKGFSFHFRLGLAPSHIIRRARPFPRRWLTQNTFGNINFQLL